MPKTKEEKNPSFSRFFAQLITSTLVVLGVYLPAFVLSANGYVGNKVMINMLSWICYFLIATGVFHGAWLVVFWRKCFCMKADPESKEWYWYLYNFFQSFEYKFSMTSWFCSAVVLFALQLIYYIFLILQPQIGLWGYPLVSSSVDFIGSEGPQSYFDDMWQSGCLIIMLASFTAMVFFVELNVKLYLYGVSKKEDSRL